MANRIAVGFVARPQGLRGELRVQLYDDGSEVLLGVDTVWIGGAKYQVEKARAAGRAVVLALCGLREPEAVDKLRQAPVEVLRAEIALADDEFFLHDLVGCYVFCLDGTPLGRVVEVVLGAQDRMVIHDETWERLLPIVPQIVESVDLTAKKITVDVPADLPKDPLR